MSQLRTLLERVLPLRRFDSATALEFVRGVQLRNHRAYLSHRQRRLAALAAGKG